MSSRVSGMGEKSRHTPDVVLGAATLACLSLRLWYPFVGFAREIAPDREAVVAALTTLWSNGPAEAHVDNIKLQKRQADGRAGLQQLRARILSICVDDQLDSSADRTGH